MRAWEIYQQDLTARQTGGELQPRQEYYNALRDALHAELTRTGRSDLLDRLLKDAESGTLTELYLLDFAVLMACHTMIVRGQPMPDTTRHVPHIRSTSGFRLAWQDMQPDSPYPIRVTPELLANLRALRDASLTLLEPQEGGVSEPLRTLQRKLEFTQDLNRHLSRQNADLTAERDDLRRQLDEMKAGYISEQVKYATEARRIQLEEELKAEYATKRAAAKTAFREQYELELLALEGRRADAAREAAAMAASVTDEYRAVRAGMMGQLRSLQAQLDQMAEDWELGLYQSESGLLARSYCSLYRLTVQKMASLMADVHVMEVPVPVVDRLMGLHNDLHDQLRQLEQAMLRLGMQVIRPEAGAAFDPAVHVPAGPVARETPAAGTRVEACVCPGVVMVKGEGLAPETLVKAEVRLTPSEQIN